MIFATCTLTYLKVGKKVEAALQNLAAGLILGAVACELEDSIFVPKAT
jgi:hypothetical protein